jgi:hypothetical protein
MTKNEYPLELGRCIDMLYEQRAVRLQLQKTIDNAKAEEAKLQDHIIETFGKSEIRGAKGDVATAAIKSEVIVELKDWDAFVTWVAKTKSFDCLRKQPGSTAVKERWDNGEEVPGVSPMTKISLSLTKA